MSTVRDAEGPWTRRAEAPRGVWRVEEPWMRRTAVQGARWWVDGVQVYGELVDGVLVVQEEVVEPQLVSDAADLPVQPCVLGAVVSLRDGNLAVRWSRHHETPWVVSDGNGAGRMHSWVSLVRGVTGVVSEGEVA